jgi:hypothetical protein
MLNTNTTGSLRTIIQQNGYKVLAVFILSSRDRKKKTLEYIVPSWDSNPASPKLASHISVKSSHLNSTGHAHSM